MGQEWRRMEYVKGVSTVQKTQNALRECTGNGSPRNKDTSAVWAAIEGHSRFSR